MYESTSKRMCPFYKCQRKKSDGSLFLYCENLRLNFKSKSGRRRYVCGYCTNGGYKGDKECTWHAELTRYYSELEETDRNNT